MCKSATTHGFTLMEMLVVVAIIVALAGMGGYYIMGYMAESKNSIAKAQCKTLSNAINTYMIWHKELDQLDRPA